jgi:hypothetical protein
MQRCEARSCRLKSHSHDCRFQNFFETILRDKEVDVLLRGDFANVPYQEVLKVKGIPPHVLYGVAKGLNFGL